jgi:predicted AAA+ superfamily ATPase
MNENLHALEKYNFWKGNIPDLGYQRRDYTDKILQYAGNKQIKVLVGQRHTGKSCLLRQIACRLIEEGVDPNN